MRLAPLALVLLASACGRSSGEAAPTSTASAAPSSSLPGPSAVGSVASSASGPAAGARSFQGTYKTSASAMVVTTDWSKTRFASPDSGAGIGEGTLALQVDPAGRATGTIDGPVGPAMLEGTLVGQQLSAAIRRKDPSDRGFAGTLVGTLASDKGAGTMTLASAEGGVVRSGTFALSSDPGR